MNVTKLQSFYNFIVTVKIILCNGGSLYAPYSLLSIYNMLCGWRGNWVVTVAAVYDPVFRRGERRRAGAVPTISAATGAFGLGSCAVFSYDQKRKFEK